MKSITFLHIADLHLDSPFKGLSNLSKDMFTRVQNSTFTSFTRLIDTAIECDVDFVIISGDLFDGEDRSLRAQTKFRKEMERLYEHKIECFIIHGNHDHLGGSWPHFTWPTNVRVFSKDHVEVQSFVKDGETIANLYGFSYLKNAVTENKTHDYVKQEGALFHIGLLHGTIEGETSHSRYAPFLVSELQQKEFDYWALGHIHKRQILSEEPPIVYPGNIQGRHRKEIGEKGGYIVKLSTNGATLTFFPTAELIWETTSLDITNISSFDQLVDKTLTHIDTLRKDKQGVLLTIEYIGRGPLHEPLLQKSLQEEILSILNENSSNAHFVYIVSLKVQSEFEMDRLKLKQESHFISDLLATIENYEDFDDALMPLRSHQGYRKLVTSFTDDELNEIVKEAETIILQNLYSNK